MGVKVVVIPNVVCVASMDLFVQRLAVTVRGLVKRICVKTDFVEVLSVAILLNLGSFFNGLTGLHGKCAFDGNRRTSCSN